jgi:Flp pilus assembly protein TadD
MVPARIAINPMMNSESRPALAHANRLVFLIALTLMAYANSFQGEFVFDDYPNILESEKIRSLEPSTWNSGQRPWFYLSLALNYSIHELDPFGYHLFNFAVHLAAGLTLFGLVRGTLALPAVAERYRDRADSIALIVAAVWLVHPLNTNAVTYIVQRCEAMMGFCFLALLYFTLRGATASRSWPWYSLAAGAFYAGIGSKEVMAVAPFVLLLFDRIFLAGSWREVIRRRWGLYLVLALPFLWFMSGLFRRFGSTSRTATVGFAYKGVTPWEYARTQPEVILHYLRLAVWPHPLCLDYGWPVARTAARIIPASIVIGCLVLTSLWALIRRPMIGFLGISFFVILAPTSSFMPIKDLAFEHRIYLPLVCVILLVTLAVDAGLGYCIPKQHAESRRGFSTQTAIASISIAVLSWFTIDRNRDFSSAASVWQTVTEVSPENPRAHHNLGYELGKLGRIEEARTAFRRCLDLKEDYASAHYFLGKCLLDLGRPEEAEAHYARSFQLDSTNGQLLTDYGWLLFQQGHHDRAEELLRAAIRHKPLPAEPHFTLARLLLSRVPPDERAALEHLHRSHAVNPNDIVVTLQLASLLATARDKTLRDGRQAISLLSPHANTQASNAAFGHCLAAAYAESGDFDTARRIAERTIALAEQQAKFSLADNVRLSLEAYKNDRASEKPTEGGDNGQFE